MRADQSPTPAVPDAPTRFKLLREIPVKDGLGRRRPVTVPMTEYVGADALGTMRSLLPQQPDADRDASGRKQATP